MHADRITQAIELMKDRQLSYAEAMHYLMFSDSEFPCRH